MRILNALASLLWLSAVPALADELTISNRQPLPDEVGYRPADGETVSLNPPSFIWLHEKDAASYVLEWATRPDFSDAQTTASLVWNTYTHNEPLKPAV